MSAQGAPDESSERRATERGSQLPAKADERQPQETGPGRGQQGDAEEAAVVPTLLKGAAFGAALGAIAGTAVAAASAIDPDRAKAVRAAITEASKDVSAAAATAARQVLTSKSVEYLLPSRGKDGDQKEALKGAAREAASAAATAARDVLVNRRSGGGADKR